jgi:hypothetical protein
MDTSHNFIKVQCRCHNQVSSGTEVVSIIYATCIVCYNFFKYCKLHMNMMLHQFVIFVLTHKCHLHSLLQFFEYCKLHMNMMLHQFVISVLTHICTLYGHYLTGKISKFLCNIHAVKRLMKIFFQLTMSTGWLSKKSFAEYYGKGSNSVVQEAKRWLKTKRHWSSLTHDWKHLSDIKFTVNNLCQ